MAVLGGIAEAKTKDITSQGFAMGNDIKILTEQIEANDRIAGDPINNNPAERHEAEKDAENKREDRSKLETKIKVLRDDYSGAFVLSRNIFNWINEAKEDLEKEIAANAKKFKVDPVYMNLRAWIKEEEDNIIAANNTIRLCNKEDKETPLVNERENREIRNAELSKIEKAQARLKELCAQLEKLYGAKTCLKYAPRSK
jgi:hypothetical protein